PLFFDFDIRLVNAPEVRRSFYMRATTPVEFRSIVLNPAVNGTMIDMQTPLQHDLFEVPITQRIPQIPPHAQQNDVGLEVTPFEGILALVAHNGNLFCSFPSTLADQLFICNTARNCTTLEHVAQYGA